MPEPHCGPPSVIYAPLQPSAQQSAGWETVEESEDEPSRPPSVIFSPEPSVRAPAAQPFSVIFSSQPRVCVPLSRPPPTILTPATLRPLPTNPSGVTMKGYLLPRSYLDSMPKDFVVFVPPPGDEARTQNAARPPGADPGPTVDAAYRDALMIRRAVFVDEQGCRADTEVDEDDFRGFHWVAYVSVKRQERPDNDTEVVAAQRSATVVPAATLRLVPPPHAPHPPPGSVDGVPAATSDKATVIHDGKEPYIKLGRFATLPPFRGQGLGSLLIQKAVEWAQAHPDATRFGWAVEPDRGGVARDPITEPAPPAETDWRGLLLVHAQTQAVPFYVKNGFRLDEELGVWVEENVEHKAMWRRVEVETSKRKREGKEWPEHWRRPAEARASEGALDWAHIEMERGFNS